MRRSVGWALAGCIAAAVACSSSNNTTNPPSGPGTGVQGQYYYVTVSPAAGGAIAGDKGINCQPGGTGCGDGYNQTKFDWATPVTLTATPAQGYTFVSWGGDCSGTSPTCTLSGTSSAVDYNVTAVFAPIAAPPPTTAGRVYGYVKDGAGKAAAGVTVSLSTTPVSTATTTSNGAFTFEVAPGTYTLSTTKTSAFQAATPVTVTLPPVGDAACVQGNYVPTAGVATAPGCLLKVADVVVPNDPAYVAPTPPTVTATPKYLAGFNQTVTVSCTLGGSNTFYQWKQTGGPTVVDVSGWTTEAGGTFTTPTIAQLMAATTAATTTNAANCPKGAGNASPNKVGCGVSNLVPEQRLGFLSINKQQAGELTYTFQCQTKDASGNVVSGTATTQLASFVNANTATMVRETPQPLSAAAPTTFADQTSGQPKVQGPLWGAQSEQFTVQEDLGTWRAHDSVVVPAGVIVVTDDVPGRTSYNWKFCGSSKSTATSCAAIPSTVANVPTINDANGPNAWFVVSWTVGKTLYLVNDAMPLSVTVTKGTTTTGTQGTTACTAAAPCTCSTASPCVTPPGTKAAIPIKASAWTGYASTATGVESCKECHSAPGLKLNPSAGLTCPAGGTGPDDGQICMEIAQKLPWCPDVNNCYERGPTDPVTEYENSKHAGILRDGGSGTHYSASCLPCHTLGYDPSVTNGGWDDVAKTAGYSLPDFPFEGSTSDLFLATMPAAVKTVSNIQCESCHGPANGSPNHTASLNSRMCAYCHDGGHHGLYSQWRQSGHANLAGAQGEGPSHGRDQTHCGRCHFAQGFTMYVDAVKSGNPDKLGNAPPQGAPSSAITTGILCAPYATTANDTCPNGQQAGLITNETVEAISCQTCHQPHSLELRITGDDSKNGLLLAGGFKVTNGGSGTICSVCHNSRNGIVGAVAPNPNGASPVASTGGQPTRHDDATPLTSANFTMTGPHSASQADVYYAGNGYLLGQPATTTANPHANPTYFADTCAECHVKRFDATTVSAGTVVNHSFNVDDTTCAGCHGTGSKYLESRQLVVSRMIGYTDASKVFHPGQYQTSLALVLGNAGITSVTGKLNGATTAAAYTVSSAIAKVAVSGDRPLTLDFTFANGDVITGCNIDAITSGSTPTLYTVDGSGVKTYGKVAKSMYDFALINNDASFGVHNIPFVDAMMDAMVNHLDSPGLPK